MRLFLLLIITLLSVIIYVSDNIVVEMITLLTLFFFSFIFVIYLNEQTKKNIN